MRAGGGQDRRQAGQAGKLSEASEKLSFCGQCGEDCEVLAMAAAGLATIIWKCPMMIGTESMDRAVALAMIRAALSDDVCIVIRLSDLVASI